MALPEAPASALTEAVVEVGRRAGVTFVRRSAGRGDWARVLARGTAPLLVIGDDAQGATQVAMVATYLPALLLSGFMFDIASMPVVLRVVTHLVPARYFITVTRGIFLKGVGLSVLWLPGLFMLLFAIGGVALATHAFRKELEG